MSRVLYHERVHIYEEPDCEGYASVTDCVEVEVRSWTQENMRPDVIIHCQVMVDGEYIVDKREAHPHNKADAKFIRMGIAKFDQLCAAHPTIFNQPEG